MIRIGMVNIMDVTVLPILTAIAWIIDFAGQPFAGARLRDVIAARRADAAEEREFYRGAP